MTPIDLSHTIEHGMITYRGLPAPLICDYLSREASRNLYAEGTEFHIGRIDMVANTGHLSRFAVSSVCGWQRPIRAAVDIARWTGERGGAL